MSGLSAKGIVPPDAGRSPLYTVLIRVSLNPGMNIRRCTASYHPVEQQGKEHVDYFLLLIAFSISNDTEATGEKGDQRRG
jgi:hypothetical protein